MGKQEKGRGGKEGKRKKGGKLMIDFAHFVFCTLVAMLNFGCGTLRKLHLTDFEHDRTAVGSR